MKMDQLMAFYWAIKTYFSCNLKLIIEHSIFDPLNQNSNDLKTEFETAGFLIACKQRKSSRRL